MASAFNFTIDPNSLREFERTLRRYGEVRKKDNAYVCNRQGAQLALRAFWNTQKANVARVKAHVRSTYVTKTGRVYDTAVDLARAIVVSRMRRRGQALVTSKIIKARDSLIAGKIHAGFIAAGWIPALQAFRKAKGAAVRIPKRAAGYGEATLAKETFNCFAEIINRSVPKTDPTGAKALNKYASEGLQKAVPIVTADMKAFIERQLEKASREASAK